MVALTLNEGLIKGGEKLVRHLDASGVKVDAALWFYFQDIQAWKLLLSLPDLIKQGPKTAYKEVQKAISKLDEQIQFSLDDVAVAKPDSPPMQLLKMAIKTDMGISNIRFSKNVINGQLIEDAFIYRLA